MRDLRDPQKLGKAYVEARKAGMPIEFAVNFNPPGGLYNYASNEGPVEKYGKPDDVEPRFERIQIR